MARARFLLALLLAAAPARAAGYVTADIDCLDEAAAMHAGGDKAPASLLYGFYLGRLNADGVTPQAVQRMMKSRALAAQPHKGRAEICLAQMNAVLKAMADARRSDDIAAPAK